MPDSLEIIELAARTCYKTEDKLGSNPNFISDRVKQGHESIIEHLSITVKFICDRGVSHELVRHRLCAFSQESTRYCNYKGGVTFIIPFWVHIAPGEYLDIDNPGDGVEGCSHEDYLWWESMCISEIGYETFINNGWSPQQARSILPNSLKTEIVVTANLREWRHIIKLRCSMKAHPQMREIMVPLSVELHNKFPSIFGEDYGLIG
jgi:thymidylate synthase (FAD)